MTPDQLSTQQSELAYRVAELERLIALQAGRTSFDTDGVLPVRITGVHPDSPTGPADVRMFQGYTYPDGSAGSSGAAVTIRIMGLAAGFSLYPSRPLLAVPIVQTWTKADASTVTETVYEAQEKLYF